MLLRRCRSGDELSVGLETKSGPLSKLETLAMRCPRLHTLHIPVSPLVKAGTGHSVFECPARCFAPLEEPQ